MEKCCKLCKVCQYWKANQVVPVALLQPIPAFDEPFSKVLVDCVGPLPKTKNGNQFLHTIMCASTRFPEAVPFRKIPAKSVVKTLVRLFSLFGIPRVVQSDQGFKDQISCRRCFSKLCSNWEPPTSPPVRTIQRAKGPWNCFIRL